MAEEMMKKQTMMKRMIATGQLTRFSVYLAVAVPAVFFIFLAFLSLAGVVNPINVGGVEIGNTIDFLILAFLISTGIFGGFEALRLRRVRKIDDRFPDFVRDLAESRRAGMTFTKAIMYSSKGNYGVLTPEIQKIARQISWGSSVEDALSAFAKRVNTKLIRRTISLIIEASRSGGNVADVLDAASKDAREIRFIESERRANMLSYVAIIYIGMIVFLVIIIILCKNFIPSMLKTGSEEVQAMLGKTAKLKPEDLTNIFYRASIIQGIGMGVVAGVFEEGRASAGVKHMFILTLIIWIMFKALMSV